MIMTETAVEWLEVQQKELAVQIKNGEFQIEDFEYYNAIYIEQAKELESKQQKDMFIGGYTSHAMKGNKLPYGLEWLTKIAEIEEEAEELYDQHFKAE